MTLRQVVEIPNSTQAPVPLHYSHTEETILQFCPQIVEMRQTLQNLILRGARRFVNAALPFSQRGCSRKLRYTGYSPTRWRNIRWSDQGWSIKCHQFVKLFSWLNFHSSLRHSIDFVLIQGHSCRDRWCRFGSPVARLLGGCHRCEV
jgi:hypothetical protein